MRPATRPPRRPNAGRGRDRDRLDAAPVQGQEAEIERLTAEVETATSQAAELLAALQRERAEFQNFRRRTAEEREREAGLAGDYLLKKVLVIADDFDRAIDARPADLEGNSWVEGIEAIDRKLRASSRARACDRSRPSDARSIRATRGDHIGAGDGPARGRSDRGGPAGLSIRDRILRPALVAVAGAPADSTGTDQAQQPIPEKD